MVQVTLQNMMARPIDGFGPPDEIVVRHFPCVFGRDPDCNVPLDHRHISRRHCCLYRCGHQLWVQDLQSLNGTFLNARRVLTPRPVENGDFLTIGLCLFRVLIRTSSSSRREVLTPAAV
jgi:pSer/pThr/pTyr-binding forkhead associated (FHA) protein